MRTRLLGVLAAAALLSAGLLIGSLGTASSAQTHRTIKGFYKGSTYTNNRRYIDADGDGDAYSYGDLVVARGNLHRNDKRVGKVFDWCSIMDPRGPGRLECSSTLDKRGGTITFSSLLHDDPSPGVTMDGAITGGTGNFEFATGTVKLKFGTSGIHYAFDVATAR
jgi:hypothetical protein